MMAGQPVLIVRALYGLRSSGKSFRDHLVMHFGAIGIVGSRADQDFWMRPASKPVGTEYY
jgi:hypothetical protein